MVRCHDSVFLYLCDAIKHLIPAIIMKAALKYFFLYVLLVIAGFFALTAIYKIAGYFIPGFTLNDSDLFGGDSWLSSFTLMVASQLLPICVFLKRKYTNFSFSFGYRFGDGFSKKKLYLWVAVASVGCLLFDMMMIMIFPVVGEWETLIFGEDLSADTLNFIFIELISGCLLAPLVEEAIFRGAIERRLLEKDWNPWFAIVISAIIFAIPHVSLYTLFLSCFGILVGWLYYRTRCIWPGILVHAIYNSIIYVPGYINSFFASSDFLSEDDESLPLKISIPLLLVGIAILYYSVKQIALLTKDRTPIKVTDTQTENSLSPI